MMEELLIPIVAVLLADSVLIGAAFWVLWMSLVVWFAVKVGEWRKRRRG